MTDIPYRTALIVGAGPGISASLARGLAAAGLKVGIAARNADKLAPLAAETGAETFAVDASQPAAVARLFDHTSTRQPARGRGQCRRPLVSSLSGQALAGNGWQLRLDPVECLTLN